MNQDYTLGSKVFQQCSGIEQISLKKREGKHNLKRCVFILSVSFREINT